MLELQKALERFQCREISVSSWDVAGNGDTERWTLKGD